MKLKSFIYCSGLALTLAFTSAASQVETRGGAGALFTMDNAAAGNHVLAYGRAADGSLSSLGAFATDGLGTGDGLGNQGALILSSGGGWLFACNAGSDEISVFRVTPHGLQLTDKVGSGGKRPISLAVHRNLLYVLNAGGLVGDADNVTAFLFSDGELSPLAGSTRPLSAANTDSAQISFSPDGNVLVVTEKATGVIDTFTVNDDGLIDEQQQFASVGQTPFGFAFRRDVLIVSEAFGGAPDASAVSSYELADDGSLQVISPSVPTTETAACWIVVTRNGHFAYASNTGSGTLSGYDVSSGGSLSLLNADGVTGLTGLGPIDMATSVNSHFLYALNSGDGTISAFRVNHDGSLSSLPGVDGIPSGANGLAAR
jgi:6-phosphogluconolactonase (cycloisomerase 2 family)